MSKYIAQVVEELIEEYDERNPFALCDLLDIELIMHDFSSEIKGYFFYHSGVKIISVNSNLDGFTQKVICAHELGHALLHEDLAKITKFADFAVFDVSAKPEMEANLFAAELLISDQKVYQALECYNNYYDVAGEIGVTAELLDFKLRMMQRKGQNVSSFLDLHGDYLKGVR